MEGESKVLDRSEKVIVHLKPVASAPILKKTKFKVQGSEPFATIITFVSTQLKLKEGIFLYCNSHFSPSPDSIISDIFKCFKVGGELIINYAVTEAWG